MDHQDDTIVDIPENRVKFFGTTGKMLLPCAATVRALVEQIPVGRLLTTDLLTRKLTAQFKVQGTCPVTTKKALQAIANDISNTAAYWRVINKNGGLVAGYPGGTKGQAERLRDEGFTIDTTGKTPKVKDFSLSLVRVE